MSKDILRRGCGAIRKPLATFAHGTGHERNRESLQKTWVSRLLGLLRLRVLAVGFLPDRLARLIQGKGREADATARGNV
jgi:hypothetical protein